MTFVVQKCFFLLLYNSFVRNKVIYLLNDDVIFNIAIYADVTTLWKNSTCFV